jgi:hypothetical protein
MPYLFYNVPVIKCISFSDSGGEAEYYATYQAYFDLDAHTLQLSQGFSLGCPIDDGYSFRRGQTRELNDPKFLMKLPDLEDGKANIITVDLFLWESDHSTEDTKKIFSNVSAERLQQVYSDAKQVKKKAKDDFKKWLEDQGLGMLSSIASALGGAATGASFVGISKQVIPLLEWGIELAKSNSDDYVGMIRTELLYRKAAGKYEYRWILNGGAERKWIDAERAPLESATRVTQASNDNQIDVNTLMQVLLEEDARPMIELQSAVAKAPSPAAALQVADNAIRGLQPRLIA